MDSPDIIKLGAQNSRAIDSSDQSGLVYSQPIQTGYSTMDSTSAS
ncbi:uncharacterized protein METZ01_LOCUS468341 [marine metagenome]|uniref:Uncharacterized protein n=1 Tax=marine metagenome TaxID=408172 RepID=A0A383B5U7_9ZZZZ